MVFDPEQKKWWALGGVALAVFAVGLDGTILAVALPTLASALHASAADLIWFSSAYLLALAAAMLPMGMLGDRYGRKKVMLLSLAGFGAASGWSAVTESPGMFVAARVVSGIAGSGVIVMALSALTVLFTAAERPRAVGIWAGVNFLALPAGPLLGGWLLTRFWWGWVFLVNLPVVLVGLIVGLALIPESRAPRRARIDVPGIVGSSAGLVALVYGFAEAGQDGWVSRDVLAAIGVGLLLLAAVLRYERRLAERGGEPLVDVRLFKDRAFTAGTVLAALSSLAMIGVLFTMPQFFQGVLGTDAVGSGLRVLPLIGGLVAGGVVAEPMVRRCGARFALVVGFAILGAGLLIGSFTAASSGELFLGLWLVLTGGGLGLTLSSASSAALARLSAERSGVGSALMQAVQELGGPLGAAVLGSVSLAAYQAHLDVGGLTKQQATAVRSGLFEADAVAARARRPALLSEVHSAFVHAMSSALVVSAGIAAVGVLVAVVFFPRSMHRVAKVAVAASPEREQLGVGQR